jgi:hypothetical protein
MMGYSSTRSSICRKAPTEYPTRVPPPVIFDELDKNQYQFENKCAETLPRAHVCFIFGIHNLIINQTMRTFTALILSVFAALSFCYGQDVEPNDSQANASPAPINTPFTGTLGIPASDNFDFFIFNLPGNGSVEAAVTFDAGLTGSVALLTPTGTFLSQSATGTGALSTSQACIGSSQILVRLTRSTGAGSYTLQLLYTPPAQANDAEPNNTSNTILLTVGENQAFTGQIGYNNNGTVDNFDHFGYNSPRNGNITFTVTGSPGLTFILRIFRPDGALLASSNTGTGTLTVTLNCQQAGTYLGRVDLVLGCGSYTGSFSTTTLPVANDAEPNNSINETQGTFAENQTLTGHIGYITNTGVPDSFDSFAYASPRNGNITFTVTGSPGLTFILRIFRPNGALLASSNTGTGTLTVTLNCQEAGTYLGRVDLASGCGSYTGSFSTTTLPVANDAEPNNSFFNETQGTFAENQTLTGHIGYISNTGVQDLFDFFAYASPRNGNITFTVTGSPGLTFTLRLFRPNGAILASSNTGTGTLTVTLNCQEAGTYLGRVDLGSGCGSYTGSFSTSTNTFAPDAEPNNVIEAATFTTTRKFNTGHLGYTSTAFTDIVDHYAIKITQVPLTLTIPIRTEETLTAVMRIFNISGALLASSASITPGVDNALTFTFNTTGVYFIRMDRNGGCGSYRFGAPCPAGGDVDNDNLCDTDDTCLVNGGWVKTSSTLTGICVGDGFPDAIQATVTGKTGQGLFGLVTFPALDVVATNATGLFNMENFPAGQYRIGHVSVPSLAALQGITNVGQLSGCFDLSNFLSVTTTALIPGTITATAGTTACGDDGIPSNLSFAVTGASGPSFRWVVLTADGSTVLANNTTGTFDFDQFGPGTYRVVRVVYTSAVNIATVDPLALPPCIRASNLITINITSCAPTIQVQPNPTTGPTQLSFTAQVDEPHTLEVYDMQGRRVAALLHQNAETGVEYRALWDGSSLPNGIYLVRLTTATQVTTQKVVLSR